MDKKLIPTIFIAIFFLSLVSAAQSNAGTFQQDSCIDLPQTCTSCTYNNITSIIYPNGTKYSFSPEQNMTKTGTDYNFYTCKFTPDIGRYQVNGHGNVGGVDTIWNYYYEVTPSGQDFSEGQSIGGIMIILVALVLAFFFMFFGFKISSNEKLMPLTILFILISFIFVVYSLHLSYAFTVDVFQYESLGGVASTIYTAILWILISVGVISTVLILISAIKEMGEIVKRKKYGEDYNPVGDAYNY